MVKYTDLHHFEQVHDGWHIQYDRFFRGSCDAMSALQERSLSVPTRTPLLVACA